MKCINFSIILFKKQIESIPFKFITLLQNHLITKKINYIYVYSYNIFEFLIYFYLYFYLLSLKIYTLNLCELNIIIFKYVNMC